MSDKSQPQPVAQDEQPEDVQPKYTVKLFGRYVPYWVVVLVLVVLAWAIWRMWNEHHKQPVGLTNSTRQNLDKLAATSANTPSAPSAGIPVASPSTEETRKQLNRLFNSF